MNPYIIVQEFEQVIAQWTGAPYAVAVESGTAALFLACQYRKTLTGSLGIVSIPARTYPSVACSVLHAGGRLAFSHQDWTGCYELSPLDIWDAALRFRRGMYTGHSGSVCLSFHIKKHLPIGRGGMVLTASSKEAAWLRRARFDGRAEQPLETDAPTMLGWNMYLTPEQAAHGLLLFNAGVSVGKFGEGYPDLRMSMQGYPDLSALPIYRPEV